MATNPTRWTWKQSPELMARLSKAQNAPANSHVDVMTFAGMCESEAELARHVEYYESRAVAA